VGSDTRERQEDKERKVRRRGESEEGKGEEKNGRKGSCPHNDFKNSAPIHMIVA